MGPDTILTEEIFNRLSADINTNRPNHILGLRLPPFSDLISINSTRFNTELPHQEFVDTFRNNHPNSPILTKIAEMEAKLKVNVFKESKI
jgi:hypothetical protein